MIVRVLTSLLATTALSAGAYAADLPARGMPPVYVPPPAHVFTWTGFYLGGNAGYAFQADRTHNLTGNNATTTAAVLNNNAAPFVQNTARGFTGGGQIGYNYEFGAGLLGDATGGIVIGAEADAAYTDLRKFQQAIGASRAVATQTNDRQDYLGTVRGRAGVALGTVLVYATGGFAYGNVSDTTQNVRTGLTPGLPGGTVGFTGSASSTRTGYAAGGGIEYAIPTTSFLNFVNAGAVTVKAEYLHYDLGTSTYRVGGIIAATSTSSFNDRVRFNGNLVRAGINYKFDAFGAAPVVARY